MSDNYIGFRLSKEMREKLNELAKKNQRSVSGQIRLLLEEALSK